MRRFAGACRFVFNQALALQKAHHEAGGQFIGYVAMAKQLTAWRNGSETPWLKQAPLHPLQHALKDLERACSWLSGRWSAGAWAFSATREKIKWYSSCARPGWKARSAWNPRYWASQNQKLVRLVVFWPVVF